MTNIKIENLDFSFSERKILDSLSLEIEKGGFFSIIGPNGAGKSTLLKNIMRFFDLSENTIFIGKKDINDMSRRELSKNLAYVPQELKRNNRIPVYDFILSGRYSNLSLWDNYSSKDRDDVDEIIKLLGLEMYRENSIVELSGGEFQRVMIARAIIQGADYIILDEPVSSLDIHYQLEIMELLKKLSKEYFTVITVLHDINLASQYSDQIILIDKGRIVGKGSPDEILTKEIIGKLYKIDFGILENPVSGTPYILPYRSNKKS